MPRSNRRRRGGRPSRAGTGPGQSGTGDGPGLDADRLRGGFRRIEHGHDGAWVVTGISGSSAARPYRCPGCDHEIPPDSPHLVVWPVDAPLAGGPALDQRRHWHTPCWRARGRRRR